MANEANKLSFTTRVLIASGTAILLILLIYGIGYIIDVFMLGFAAILLAVFLRGLADILSHRVKISEGKAVLVVSVVLLIILAGSIALLAPSVAKQAAHLREELPRSAQNVAETISSFSWGKAIVDQMPGTQELINKISTSSFLSSVGGFFSTTAGVIANFFITILLAIYLASEPKVYLNGLIKMFPIASRPRIKGVLEEIGETLR